MLIPEFTGKGPPNCSVSDPDIFFPEEGDPQLRQKNKAAKKVCEGCPYQMECLEYAIAEDEVGTWGGKTRSERLYMKRKRVQSGEPVSLGIPSYYASNRA
jgi:hypothetical protein